MGQELVVDVGPVAHGGHCVARHEGRVLFVRHSLPGERVRVVVTEGRERDRFLRADAVEVLVASPERVPRPCPYAGPGRCGGCDWQHASLARQRELKAAVIEEQLRRLAGLDLAVVVEPVPTAEGEEVTGLGWRTRVHYAVDEQGRAGLRRHRSHVVELVDRCRIAIPEVVELGVTRRAWPEADSVEAIAASSGEHAVVVSPPGPTDATVVHERAAARSWRVSGSTFWQVHTRAAEVLVAAVLEGLAPREGESALDLYGGVGLFAGALGSRLGASGHVTLIEGDAIAVADARHNLADLGPRAVVRRGEVSNVLAALGATVDLVVLDPPRSGAGRTVVGQIASTGARAVAYVACDPAALARDVAWFAEHGYVLASLRAFDLFPMTAHVECVALLVPPG